MCLQIENVPRFSSYFVIGVSIIDPLIEVLHQAKDRVGLRPVLYLQLSLNHYVLYSLTVRKLTLRTGQGRLNFVASLLPPPSAALE